MAKLGNEYAHEIPDFDAIPKTVLGAIAISLAVMMTGNEDWEKAVKLLITEWHLLHNAQIVPQSVPAKLRSYILRSEEM